MPLISYVVTLYNKEKFLPFLLHSLNDQRGDFEREFIFVDDGSTDDTLKAITAMTTSWSRVTILTQKNAGPAVATNAGFARARGDYVKPLDGDDVLAPWASASHLNAMVSENVGVSFTRQGMCYNPQSASVLAELSILPQTISGYARVEHPLVRSIRRPTVNPSAWMARRDVIERTGPCDPNVFIQDYSIELRLAADGPLVELEDAVFACPLVASDRLSDNQSQILHDASMAAIRFVRDTVYIAPHYRTVALQRAAKRAVSWETRRGKSLVALDLQWILLRAKLGMLRPTPEIEEALCAPFRRTGGVRLMPR